MKKLLVLLFVVFLVSCNSEPLFIIPEVNSPSVDSMSGVELNTLYGVVGNSILNEIFNSKGSDIIQTEVNKLLAEGEDIALLEQEGFDLRIWLGKSADGISINYEYTLKNLEIDVFAQVYGQIVYNYLYDEEGFFVDILGQADLIVDSTFWGVFSLKVEFLPNKTESVIINDHPAFIATYE